MIVQENRTQIDLTAAQKEGRSMRNRRENREKVSWISKLLQKIDSPIHLLSFGSINIPHYGVSGSRASHPTPPAVKEGTILNIGNVSSTYSERRRISDWFECGIKLFLFTTAIQWTGMGCEIVNPCIARRQKRTRDFIEANLTAFGLIEIDAKDRRREIGILGTIGH